MLLAQHVDLAAERVDIVVGEVAIAVVTRVQISAAGATVDVEVAGARQQHALVEHLLAIDL